MMYITAIAREVRQEPWPHQNSSCGPQQPSHPLYLAAICVILAGLGALMAYEPVNDPLESMLS